MSNLGIISSQTFSPNKFGGLKLWLKANDPGTIIDTGGLVDQWISKSTVTNKATQTGSNRPTTNSRTINGQNVLDFDGVDDFMTLDNQPIIFTVARTIIVVALADAAVGENIFISLSHNTIINGDLYRVTAEVGLRISGANRIFANDSIDDGINPAILIFTNQTNSDLTYDVNNFQAYKNGALITSTSDVNPTTTVDTESSSATVIGDEGLGGANRLNGVIGEIIIYDRVIPTSERQETESYLSNDWRIPLV